MEPFRALIADLLPPEQRTRGYAMLDQYLGPARDGHGVSWVGSVDHRPDGSSETPLGQGPITAQVAWD